MIIISYKSCCINAGRDKFTCVFAPTASRMREITANHKAVGEEKKRYGTVLHVSPGWMKHTDILTDLFRDTVRLKLCPPVSHAALDDTNILETMFE